MKRDLNFTRDAVLELSRLVPHPTTNDVGKTLRVTKGSDNLNDLNVSVEFVDSLSGPKSVSNIVKNSAFAHDLAPFAFSTNLTGYRGARVNGNDSLTLVNNSSVNTWVSVNQTLNVNPGETISASLKLNSIKASRFSMSIDSYKGATRRIVKVVENLVAGSVLKVENVTIPVDSDYVVIAIFLYGAGDTANISELMVNYGTTVAPYIVNKTEVTPDIYRGQFNTVKYGQASLTSGMPTIYATIMGNTTHYRIAGSIPPNTVFIDGDIPIGRIPDDTPHPLNAVSFPVVNVSNKNMPQGSFRLFPNGTITVNFAGDYTSGSTVEYIESSTSIANRRTYNPYANYKYKNIVTLETGSGMQGVGHVGDYYFGIVDRVVDGNTNALLNVYNKQTNTSTVIDGGFGLFNTGYVGHGNDLTVLLDDRVASGKIYIGASHLTNAGMPIFSYNPTTNTVAKEGSIAFTAADGSLATDAFRLSSSQLDGNVLTIKTTGYYYKGTVDLTKLSTTQSVAVNKFSKSYLSGIAFAEIVGQEIAPILSVSQADWVVGNKIYYVRTADTATTVSSVIECIVSNPDASPVPTGRYWLIDEMNNYNNEIEKVWVENNVLKANVNYFKNGVLNNVMVDLGAI